MRRSSLAITPLALPLAALAAFAALATGACGSKDDITPIVDAGAKPAASITAGAGKGASSSDAGVTPDGASPDAGGGAVAPHAEEWDVDFALPGLSGPPTLIANAIAVFGNRHVAVAGQFDYAGSVAAKNVNCHATHAAAA